VTTPLRQEMIRLANEVPALRRHLVPLIRQARQTTERIRVKLTNLGDFGGTDPIRDSWHLDVAGPYEQMQQLVPTLKKFGLRWDPRMRKWSLRATLYAYGNRKRTNFWNVARRNQKAGYPVIKAEADRINRESAAANPGEQLSPKELMQKLQRNLRMLDRLPAMGLEVKYEWPNRYSVAEGKAWVLGNTFPIKDLMRKHKFRWTSGKHGKAWMMPAQEFLEVGNAWLGEVIRTLGGGKKTPAVDPDARAMFTEMSDRELTKYLEPLVQADLEANEFYDGEVTPAQVMFRMRRELKRMSPAQQEAEYLKNQGGAHRPRWASKTAALNIVKTPSGFDIIRPPNAVVSEMLKDWFAKVAVHEGKAEPADFSYVTIHLKTEGDRVAVYASGGPNNDGEVNFYSNRGVSLTKPIKWAIFKVPKGVSDTQASADAWIKANFSRGREDGREESPGELVVVDAVPKGKVPGLVSWYRPLPTPKANFAVPLKAIVDTGVVKVAPVEVAGVNFGDVLLPAGKNPTLQDLKDLIC